MAVAGISHAVDIVAGYVHACALLAAGTVECWGDNAKGQLGNGTYEASTVPVAVKGINRAVALTSGWTHSCAVLAGGGVVCWGSNNFGELGNGSGGFLQRSNVPVTVTGMNRAFAIDAGRSHTCALLSGGSAQCWGWNFYGQLGDGTYRTNARLPVAVAGLSHAIALSAGESHTCAVLAGGGIECWGGNSNGQLAGC